MKDELLFRYDQKQCVTQGYIKKVLIKPSSHLESSRDRPLMPVHRSLEYLEQSASELRRLLTWRIPVPNLFLYHCENYFVN